MEIKNQQFIVTGASSGFGLAIVRELCNNNANVIGIARREEELQKIKQEFPDQFEFIIGDITHPDTISAIEEKAKEKTLHGIVLNAGGPPIGTAKETTMQQWDDAFQLVFRWKVALIRRILPMFEKHMYGRVLFIESQSIKQPIPNLAQSNAMRAAIAGYAKTLAQEVGKQGITINIMAPGPHHTPAIERVIKGKIKQSGKTHDEILSEMENNLPVGRLGQAEELASLAVWLLSPKSGFVTGQTISHDGGNIRHITG